MLKLDNDLLDELGLGSLPDDQKQAMLQHIYETLELRVGTNLANQMTDQQLDEFEKFIDDKGEANQAQALQWLEANLPNYKQVVNDVFEQLKGEIRQMAPQLLAASGQQSAQAPTQPISQTAPGGSYAPPAPAYQVPPQPSQPYQQPMGYQQQPPQSMQQPMQPPMPAYDTGAGSQLPPAGPAQPPQQGQQQSTTPFAQPQQDDDGDQTGQLQPPAGPGSYPPQHPTAQ